jgi:hypothetical protein
VAAVSFKNAITQHAVSPFQAIIAEGNPAAVAGVVTAGEADEHHPLMVSAHTWEVKSVGTALAKARGSGLMFNLNFLANLSCTGVPKANRLPQEPKPALDVLARHGRRRRKADYAVREARINS